MKPRFLILGTTLNHEIKGLQAACQKLDVEFESKLFSDLQFNSNTDFGQMISELEKFDHIVCRVEGQLATQIRTFLVANSPTIRDRMLNGHSYADYPIMSKIQQYALFAKNGIPIPETQYQGEYPEVPELPVIIKGIFGSKGNAVHLVKDEAEFRKFEAVYGIGGFVVQKPLPIGQDYRIVVLGNRVLGGMKKVADEGVFLTNIHAGGHATEVEAERSELLGQIALKAVHVTQCDFGGVDIMFDADGRPRVLEVNRGAAYAGFEQVNPFSVSEEIIKYLLQK